MASGEVAGVTSVVVSFARPWCRSRARFDTEASAHQRSGWMSTSGHAERGRWPTGAGASAKVPPADSVRISEALIVVLCRAAA